MFFGYAVLVGEVHAVAQVVALRVRHHRDVVGVLERERDLAVRARLVAVDEVLGRALELRRRARDRRCVLTDVAAELLADRDELLLDLLDPRPGRLVLVHAAQAEIAERALDVVLGLRVGAGEIHGRDRVVHLPVEREVRDELGDLLRQALGGRAGGGVRAHLLHEPALRAGHVELAGDLVERLERVREVALALDVPTATVRTRYFRARNLLRSCSAGWT